MVSYIFQRFAKKGRAEGITPDNSMKARKWFRNMAQNVSYVNANDFMKGDKNENKMMSSLTQHSVGNMYMFFYDAKLKRDLPYWDKFPLIFPIEFYSDGFLGINLHYLSPVLRARLMDALYTTRTDNNYDEETSLQINYRILNNARKFRLFRPCVKKYLTQQIRSNFLYIHPNEWDLALMLPTERFVGAAKGRVFRESAQKSN